jgi:hypothetical protein
LALSNQPADHPRAGFGVAEVQPVELCQKRRDGLVVRRTGHAVESDGQGLGPIVGLDVGVVDEQFAHQRARLGLVGQVAP